MVDYNQESNGNGISRRNFLATVRDFGLGALATTLYNPLDALTKQLTGSKRSEPGFYDTILRHGRTDGKNLPFMAKGKFMAIRYDSSYGLIDVLEEDGRTPYFEARVDIEDLLSEVKTRPKEEINKKVESHIMKAYGNYVDSKNNPGNYETTPGPKLEILTDKT